MEFELKRSEKKQIWKFVAHVRDKQIVKMPSEAEIISIQTQHDNICIWAIVDPIRPIEPRFIEVYGTGHDMDIVKEGKERKLLGTCQFGDGSLVWHVFEVINKPYK